MRWENKKILQSITVYYAIPLEQQATQTCKKYNKNHNL